MKQWDVIEWSKVPVTHMEGAIRRYVERGIPPGHFMTALLSNDLSMAVGRADDENAAAIAKWVVFIHCQLPNGCHGSPGAVREWIAKGGLQGREQPAA